MDDATQDFAVAIKAALPQAVTQSYVAFGESNLVVDAARILDVLAYLRDDPAQAYFCLLDITATDYPSRNPRFDVVYHLLSPRHNRRIRVKVPLEEDGVIASCVGLFPTANWFERETYDMFGVLFAGHPDLRRLLTDYGFDGHPLRKDFPMSGFVEVRYDDEEKRVVYEPVRLNQEFRQFDFLSPWEGSLPEGLPGDIKGETNGKAER